MLLAQITLSQEGNSLWFSRALCSKWRVRGWGIWPWMGTHLLGTTRKCRKCTPGESSRIWLCLFLLFISWILFCSSVQFSIRVWVGWVCFLFLFLFFFCLWQKYTHWNRIFAFRHMEPWSAVVSSPEMTPIHFTNVCLLNLGSQIFICSLAHLSTCFDHRPLTPVTCHTDPITAECHRKSIAHGEVLIEASFGPALAPFDPSNWHTRSLSSLWRQASRGSE